MLVIYQIKTKHLMKTATLESMPTHIRDGIPLIRQVASHFFDISSELLDMDAKL